MKKTNSTFLFLVTSLLFLSSLSHAGVINISTSHYREPLLSEAIRHGLCCRAVNRYHDSGITDDLLDVGNYCDEPGYTEEDLNNIETINYLDEISKLQDCADRPSVRPVNLKSLLENQNEKNDAKTAAAERNQHAGSDDNYWYGE